MTANKPVEFRWAAKIQDSGRLDPAITGSYVVMRWNGGEKSTVEWHLRVLAAHYRITLGQVFIAPVSEEIREAIASSPPLGNSLSAVVVSADALPVDQYE